MTRYSSPKSGDAWGQDGLANVGAGCVEIEIYMLSCFIGPCTGEQVQRS